MDAPGEMEQARGDQPRTCRLLPLPWRGPASVRGGTAMQGWSRLAKVWWVCQGMARWPREHGNWRCTPPVGRNVWPVRHCSDFTFISFPFLFILNWFCFFCITVGFEPQDGRRWPWPRHGLIKVNGDTHSQKYVDEATKKEVKDIFRPLWPHPPRRRPQALRAQEVWWARRYQKSCRNC